MMYKKLFDYYTIFNGSTTFALKLFYRKLFPLTPSLTLSTIVLSDGQNDVIFQANVRVINYHFHDVNQKRDVLHTKF